MTTHLKTLNDILHYAEELFEKSKIFYGHGTDNAWDEAVALIFPILGISYEEDESILQRLVTDNERAHVLDLINRRIKERIPVPYLTNETYFCGLPFYVDQRVLIPRSPIAELIINQFSPWVDPDKVTRILEIGTGSGCIAIACAYTFPDIPVDATDIDNDVLEVAKINVEKHQLNNQVRLIQSDLFSSLPPQKYDIIVTNPPYVDAEDMRNLPKEFRHEPKGALAAGEDGLILVDIILKEASNYLNDKGILIVEVGNSQRALQKKYPQLPFIWLQFEFGGDGVFLLTKEQLNPSLLVGEGKTELEKARNVGEK
jgi:ribosomal protein L3 glutamine methyltransferase